jgi:hypothetical protein
VLRILQNLLIKYNRRLKNDEPYSTKKCRFSYPVLGKMDVSNIAGIVLEKNLSYSIRQLGIYCSLRWTRYIKSESHSIGAFFKDDIKDEISILDINEGEISGIIPDFSSLNLLFNPERTDNLSELNASVVPI